MEGNYTPTGKEADLQPFCEAVSQHFDAQHVFIIVKLKDGPQRTLVGLAADNVPDAIQELPITANTVLGQFSQGKLRLLCQTPHGTAPVPYSDDVNRYITPQKGKGGVQ